MFPETQESGTQGADVTPAKGARKPGKKAPAKGKAKEKSGAWKKSPAKLAELKKAIPLGSLVKYVGSRVDGREGKSGTVIGYRDANGLSVDFGKLGKGTISVPKTEVLRKGPAKGSEKEAASA